MEQDSLHKIITIEIEYSKLVKSWAEAQKVIDDTRQSIKNLKKEDADYYQKMALYKAVIREKTDAQRQLMKQINEQVKKDAQLDGSVNKLRRDISKLTKEYYALSEADRKAAKGMKMAEQVRNMQTEVNKAEQDLLNFRSNVGNYASALSPFSFQVQQVARELPSLTMSAQQFFLAISNNLPMLADELKRASTNNKLLRAEGKMTIPVFRQVLASILSWQTALVVGITLLTAFGKEIGTWVKGLFSADNALLDITQHTQEINREVETSRAELRREFDALREAKKGTAEYAAARKVIEDKYGDYLSNQREEIRNLENQKAAYDALASSITAAAIAKGLEKSNANAAEEYGEVMDKAFKGVQDKFIKKFGREAGIAYFTEFRAGLDSEIPELKERAQEIYALFESAPDGMNIIDTWREIFTGQKIGSTSHNELENTLQKVRGAMDRYNETLSANKIAMQSLMHMYKIGTKEEGKAIEDLIKRKEKELADINSIIATTEDEIISRNKKAEAVENEIKRLKELGRTNETALNVANKIERQAAKTQLDLEKRLSKSTLELRQASLEKELELSRMRFAWERQELENKLKYDKTLTAKSREAINQLIMNMEERRYKEEAEIRQRWAAKEYEEDKRNEENRILMRLKIQGEMNQLAAAQVKNKNYAALNSGIQREELRARQAIADEELRQAQANLDAITQMAEEEWVAKYNTMQQYEIARLEAENRVQDAIRTTTQLAIQGEIDQLTATQSMVGSLHGLFGALGDDFEVFAIAQQALAVGQAVIDAQKATMAAMAACMPLGPIAGPIAFAAQKALIQTQLGISLATILAQTIPSFFAQGGLVTGPGTGTSDSIVARVSNGEAIMTAQAVNDWGAVLSAMNVSSGGNAIQVSNLPQRGDGMRGMKQIIQEAMSEMPAPVVSVVDINKGQKRVKVSSNLAKLGRIKYK